MLAGTRGLHGSGGWSAAAEDWVLVGYSRVIAGTPVVPLRYWHARLLRHGPRAVLSCAGAYVSGAAGSDACPAGSVRIEAEAACRTAAAAAGKPAGSPFVETDPTSPRGCYYFTGDSYAYLNTHAVGAGDSYCRLLCAALTTGAPLKRRRRTGARSACTGARTCRHRACAARHSWAVCIIHGRRMDGHTYTNGYLYTHIYTRMMPTVLVGGAARRTAAPADGGRAGTGT